MSFNDKIAFSDCINLVEQMRGLSAEERRDILNSSSVREKFRKDFLIECNAGDAYRNFRKAFEVLSIDDIFAIFDYSSIHDAYRKLGKDDFPLYDATYEKRNFELISKYDAQIESSTRRNHNEYIFFVCLFEIDIDKAMKYILEDNNLFIEVMRKADDMYSCFALLGYDTFLKVIHKLDEIGSDKFDSDTFIFISAVSSDYISKLLDEDISDDLLICILPYFDKKVISSFFENDKRAVYLYEKFNFLLRSVLDGAVFNRDILIQDKFFDRIKSVSFVDFRRNVNALEKYNDPMVVEKKVNKYYDELIGEYNFDSGLFKTYDVILNNPELIYSYFDYNFIYDMEVRFLFYNHLDYDNNGNLCFGNKKELLKELRKTTNKKIGEVVVDSLFCDNIYNVWINIREMFRFNNKLSSENRILDDDKIMFYKMILDIDNVSCEKKIELFENLRNRNINFVFYDDLRKLKDVSYELIKKDLIDLSTSGDLIDLSSSQKYGTTVYDLRDSKYTMLVRAQYFYRDKSGNRRNCYSIISDENSETYENGGGILYGYNSFDNDRVIHVLEQDAFSSDATFGDEVSRYVNRIMTSRELVNGSHWYSEIEIVNLQNPDGKFDVKRPDFIVAYEEIRDDLVNESKRLGIPIVVIRKKKIRRDDIIDIEDEIENSKYVRDSSDEKEMKKRR